MHLERLENVSSVVGMVRNVCGEERSTVTSSWIWWGQQRHWLRLTFIISFTNSTPFAVYNHACYNIQVLIKLLTFFIQRLQTFLFLSSFFYVFNVFCFNMKVFLHLRFREVIQHQWTNPDCATYGQQAAMDCGRPRHPRFQRGWPSMDTNHVIKTFNAKTRRLATANYRKRVARQQSFHTKIDQGRASGRPLKFSSPRVWSPWRNSVAVGGSKICGTLGSRRLGTGCGWPV